jgi:N-methylhydantoinase A
MTAPGEQFQPKRSESVAGDGRAACYAEREIYFAGRRLVSQFYRRESLLSGDVLRGPAMITEYTSATLLPPGDTARVDEFGNIVISIASDANERRQ